jgi:hypothetical protein
MVTPILPILVACFTGMPVQVDMNAPSSNFFFAAKERNVILIAQKYGGEDPHGADPHGDDPNDEIHDKELPANKEQKAHKAPKDVYGGEYPNSQAPY